MSCKSTLTAQARIQILFYFGENVLLFVLVVCAILASRPFVEVEFITRFKVMKINVQRFHILLMKCHVWMHRDDTMLF